MLINLLCGYIGALRVKGSFKIPSLQVAEAMTLLRFIRKVSGSNISRVLTKVYDIFYEIL